MWWLIKTEHGYKLEDNEGNFVQWFDMACNSKAYCMEKGIAPVYLTRKACLNDKKAYTAETGKTLWFDWEY
jgi:hypothetical protein